MPRVVHFEIHAESPQRAARFYEAAFGWRLEPWAGSPDYWVITTGDERVPGINGGLLRRRGPAPASGQPVNAYVCTIEVPSIDLFIEQVIRHGGTMAVPKVALPGVGWSAYCKDTEGNIFGLMQTDPAAT